MLLALVGCRLAGAPDGSPTGSPATSAGDAGTLEPIPSESLTASSTAIPSPTPSGGAAIDVDLEAIRAALVGPSPVPEGWEDEVDELMAMLEEALASIRLPVVDGLTAEEAACATWRPLVGKQLWATGALFERQVFIAHLAQLASVAPDAIRSDADEALRVSSAAAAEQLTPGGDSAVVSRAPREELRHIGMWMVDHCELPIEADGAPDTTDWTDEDLAYSCDLDRSSLERAMEEYLEETGEYATHPHQLEVSLEVAVYPAWHQIASVDNQASPPTFSVEPIPDAFCDR